MYIGNMGMPCTSTNHRLVVASVMLYTYRSWACRSVTWACHPSALLSNSFSLGHISPPPPTPPPSLPSFPRGGCSRGAGPASAAFRSANPPSPPPPAGGCGRGAGPASAAISHDEAPLVRNRASLLPQAAQGEAEGRRGVAEWCRGTGFDTGSIRCEGTEEKEKEGEGAIASSTTCTSGSDG